MLYNNNNNNCFALHINIFTKRKTGEGCIFTRKFIEMHFGRKVEEKNKLQVKRDEYTDLKSGELLIKRPTFCLLQRLLHIITDFVTNHAAVKVITPTIKAAGLCRSAFCK